MKFKVKVIEFSVPKEVKRILWGIAIFVFFVVALDFNISADIAQYPEKQPAHKQDHSLFAGPIFSFLWRAGTRLWHWIDHNDKVLVVLFTGAIFVVTWWLAKVTKGLFVQTKSIAEDSKATMIESRRAWVSIEEVRLMQHSAFDMNGAGVKIGAIVKNCGQTPATHVWVSIHHYFLRGDFQKIFDGHKVSLKAPHPGLGVVLFPSKPFPFYQEFGITSEECKAAAMATMDGKHIFSSAVFVGVSYKISGDDSTHFTCQQFALPQIQVPFVVTSEMGTQLGAMPIPNGEAN
jgi:hypothetical protein